MQPTDEALVARAVALADDAAFEALMLRHQARIFHLLRRFTRDVAVAEELSQETFLRAWRKLRSFDRRGSFSGWLATVAYNVFLQHRRHNRRDDDTESLDDPSRPAATVPSVVDDGGAASLDLDRLLAVVSADEQRLLILSYAAGLSATEIALMLNCSAGTVKSQIHRAKQKIRQAFQIESEP